MDFVSFKPIIVLLLTSIHLLLHLSGDLGRPGAVFNNHSISLLKKCEHNLIPDGEIDCLFVRLVLGKDSIDVVQPLLRILLGDKILHHVADILS